jgi:hypothetical protein
MELGVSPPVTVPAPAGGLPGSAGAPVTGAGGVLVARMTPASIWAFQSSSQPHRPGSPRWPRCGPRCRRSASGRTACRPSPTAQTARADPAKGSRRGSGTRCR